MAKTGSYIKLDRGLKSNSLWLEKPFSRGQAWVDLLLLAQGVDKDKQYRGKIQHQKSGEVYTSVLYLTGRWGWSRNKVYRFLDYLIKAGMIVIQGRTQNDTTNRTRNGTYNGTTNGTIISIENWALYQTSDANDDTNNGTQDGTTKRTRNGTHNRKQYTRESIKENANKYNSRSAPDFRPETIEEIVPERDLAGFPDFEHMPCEADGTKRDIPPNVRHLFDGDYRAYWRYMERCSTK